MVLTVILQVNRLFLGGAAFTALVCGLGQQYVPLPEGGGLAIRYPGDAGISADPAVVFAENFENGDVSALGERWDDVSNRQSNVLFFEDTVSEFSSGGRSLRMTAARGQNSGGHLFRVLKPGYDRLFLRFYVKFAADNGFNHHFVSLGGALDPPPYPIGGAGLRPENSWNSGIEPVPASQQTVPATEYPPPGIWHFYTYWPEMRSWQNLDGTGTSFYGNDFEPQQPVIVRRGEWICVEAMVKMNSSPEATDGEQAFWIDGKLMAHFGPGTVNGTWTRDIYRIVETGRPFEGIRWRTHPLVNINKLWLSHYVSDDAFARSDRYLASNPSAQVNTQTNTVWFDDIVVSTEYIGPLQNAAGTTGRRRSRRR